MNYTFSNKKDQIKTLTDFIDEMAHFRIHNEGGDDWKYFRDLGRDEIEDQLSGVSGRVNEIEVFDVFCALAGGLSMKELESVSDNLKYSTWIVGDDYHYIYSGL